MSIVMFQCISELPRYPIMPLSHTLWKHKDRKDPMIDNLTNLGVKNFIGPDTGNADIIFRPPVGCLKGGAQNETFYFAENSPLR